jgi:type IV secretion system protein VirB1
MASHSHHDSKGVQTMIDIGTIQLCAPTVAPITIVQIIRTESGGDPYALNVNGFGRIYPKGAEAARVQAEAAIQGGYSVDIGLMQINSQHLKRFRLSVRQAFDPCTNLRVGAALLKASYLDAVRIYGRGQVALQHALSAYNTGDFERGLDNGYVAKYYHPPVDRARRRERHSMQAAKTLSASVANSNR